MRICYVFPSRERPKKFFSCLDNIQDMSDSKDYFVWGKLDNDDPHKAEYESKLHEYPELTIKWGTSKNKIHAINRDLEDLPECDIIIIMADDIRWTVFAFDNEIRDAFAKFSPDFTHTIHFPEKHGGQNTIIVSILGINLYKELGHLYHPEYAMVYCDNEFTEKTKMMGKYVFVNRELFLHLHPIWNLAAFDDLYRKNESPEYYLKDRDTFNKRKANRFDL
jgi:hypothetical protein